MKFAYYPGCSAQTTCFELDESMKIVARELGIEIVELDVAGCTGAREIRDLNQELFMLLNARTLALAERAKLDILTVCATCQLNLAEVNRGMRSDPALMAKVNEGLSRVNLSYSGTVEVKHLLWVIARDEGLDQLKGKVSRPLRGLRIAPFYGCHILRPKQELGFDDPDRPSSLENLIRTLGGVPVDYRGRTRCCGFHVLLTDEEISLKIAGRRLTEAGEGEADCLVTTCPLCHTALDPYQRAIEDKVRRSINLPVLHLPQLVGLALGVNPRDLKLSSHLVSPERMLAKIGLRM